MDGLLIKSQEIDRLLLIKISIEDKLNFLEANGIKKSLKTSVITMNQIFQSIAYIKISKMEN